MQVYVLLVTNAVGAIFQPFLVSTKEMLHNILLIGAMGFHLLHYRGNRLGLYLRFYVSKIDDGPSSSGQLATW